MKDRSVYFVSRHAEETAAADAAATQAARIAHLELALRYSLLAAQPPAAPKALRSRPKIATVMIRPVACLGLLLILVAMPVGAKTGDLAVLPTVRNQTPSNVLLAVRTAASFGTVTSVLRSAAHNRAVGGVQNSYHLRGQALDVVRRPGVSHQALEVALIVAGYQIVESLDEGDHSHFAFAAQQLSPPRGVARSPVPPTEAQPTGDNPSTKPLPRGLTADEHGTLLMETAPLIRDEPKPVSETPERKPQPADLQQRAPQSTRP